MKVLARSRRRAGTGTRWKRRGFVRNSFCPTGEGGGVDPTCSPGSSDSSNIIYHGTSVGLANSILANGLEARKPNTSSWGLEYKGPVPKGVYGATSPDRAAEWVLAKAENAMGEEIQLGNVRVCIFKIRVPSGSLKDDPMMEGAKFYSKDIPPEWIVGVAKDVRFLPDRVNGRPVIAGLKFEDVTGNAEHFYVAILVKDADKIRNSFCPTKNGVTTHRGVQNFAASVAPSSNGHGGSMIALRIPDDMAAKIAQPGGESPEELHITLAYIKSKDLDRIKLAQLETIHEVWSRTKDKVRVALAKLATFPPSPSSDGKHVLHAVVESPGLLRARNRLTGMLDRADIGYSKDFKYAPHVTLKYLDARPADLPPFRRVTFDATESVMTKPAVTNAFCPTGPGGGIDPTCSPKPSKTIKSDSEYVKDRADWEASLSSGEKVAIREWLSDTRKAARMRKAIADPKSAKLNVTKIARVFKEAIDRAPLKSGTYYRGIQVPEGELDSYKTGESMSFGLQSFGENQKAAEFFGLSRGSSGGYVVFKVSGGMSSLHELSTNPKHADEKEFLPHTGQQFKIVAVEEISGEKYYSTRKGRLIHLIEVESVAANAAKPHPSPLRADPTRTSGIRRRWVADVKRRLASLKAAVRKFLVTDDELGLVTNTFNPDQPRDESGKWTSTGWGTLEFQVSEFDRTPEGYSQAARPRKPFNDVETTKHEQALLKKLTDDEKTALFNYADDQSINEVLRGGEKTRQERGLPKLDNKQVTALDAVINKGRMPRTATLHRILSFPDQDSGLEQLAGKIIQDKGYLSTSVDEHHYHQLASERAEESDENQGYGSHYAKMRILVPKGAHAAFIGGAVDASKGEVLLPRNAKLRIHSVSEVQNDSFKVGGRKTYSIVAEYVDDELGLVTNAFCPTGPGGGVDPTCSPGGGKDTETFDAATGGVGWHAATRGEFDKPSVDIGSDADIMGKGFYFGVKHKADYFAEQSGSVSKPYKIVGKFANKNQWVAALAKHSQKGLMKQRESARSDLKKQGYSGVWQGEAGIGVVWDQNALVDNVMTINAQRFRFASTPEKLAAFRKWLSQQMRLQGLLFLSEKAENEWWERYIAETYKKGQGRAFEDTMRRKIKPALAPDKLRWYEGTQEEFLRSSFNQPATLERVKTLASRTFLDLKGFSDDMATRTSRVLVDGLIKGTHPRALAKELADAIDVSESRAETIARTETIRAHAEGQLDAMENLGVAEVGVAVEWATAGDDSVCPLCQPLEGVVLKVDEAHGLLPRHPRCRCAFQPAGLGEDDEDQKWRRREVERAIRDSLEEDSGKTVWPGAELELDPDRPEPVVNYGVEDWLREQSAIAADRLVEQTTTLPSNELVRFDMATNAFCPTGEGGGVDPTCSPGEKAAVDAWVTGGAAVQEIRSGGPRATEFLAALEKAPDATGKAYRGIGGLSDDALDEIVSGKELVLDKLESFSGSLSKAKEFAAKKTFGNEALVLIKADLGAGSDLVKDMSRMNRYGEREIVAKPGAKFKVTSTKEIEIDGKLGYELTVKLIAEADNCEGFNG